MLENRFTLLEPTMRTADVLQFCPWSACKINSTFSASTKSTGHLVALARKREHHVQEVLAVSQMVLRIDERLADRLLVAERRDGGHFGQHAVHGQFGLFRIGRVAGVFVVDGQRTDDCAEDGHRMGVARKTSKQGLHALVQQRVPTDVGAEILELVGRGQLAVDQQVGRLAEVALFGDLLNGVAPIAEHARLAVEIADRAHRRPGIGIPVVQRDMPGHPVKLRDIDGPISLGPNPERQLVLLVANL